MSRLACAAAALLLAATFTPFATGSSFAETAAAPPASTGTDAAPPHDRTGGNGVTTGTTSGPEMKAGAERSPTAGAPVGAGSSTGHAPN